MPRVTLTPAQREAAKKQDRAKKLADGLLIHKALGRLTYEQMAQQIGIDKRCLRKIVDGQDCYIPVSAALAMVEMVGGVADA